MKWAKDYHALLPISLSDIQLNNKEGDLKQHPCYSK